MKPSPLPATAAALSGYAAAASPAAAPRRRESPQVKARYDEKADELLPASQRRGPEDGAPVDVPELEIRHGSFAETDVSEADVAYCHCAGFDKITLGELVECLKAMTPGSFAITTTHPLPESADFETVDNDVLEMDGVDTLVFIAKKHPPGALAVPEG